MGKLTRLERRVRMRHVEDFIVGDEALYEVDESW